MTERRGNAGTDRRPPLHRRGVDRVGLRPDVREPQPRRHRDDLVGSFQAGTAADVAMAVRAAETAFPAWRATPAPKRGEILYRFARAAPAATRSASRAP